MLRSLPAILRPPLLAVALMAAAVPAPAAPHGSQEEAPSAADALGRLVDLPEDPRRVVALAPNLAEIVHLLGEGRRLVGRTENSRHPPEIRALPSVGGMARPSLEAVLALEPDLVLATTEGNHPGVVERLEELGVPVWTADRDSTGMEGVFASVLSVARALGVRQKGEELVRRGREDLRTHRARSEGETLRRALLLVWTRPPIAAGEATYLDDLLEAAGARNAAADLEGDWPRLGREGLASLAPDVILVVRDMEGETPPGLEDLQAIPGLAARWAVVEGDPLLRPSPAALEAVPALREALNPAPAP